MKRLLILLLIISSVLYSQESYVQRDHGSGTLGNGHFGFATGRLSMFQFTDRFENDYLNHPFFFADVSYGGFLDFKYVGIYLRLASAISAGGIGSGDSKFEVRYLGDKDYSERFDKDYMISWYTYAMRKYDNAIFNKDMGRTRIYPENYYIEINNIHRFIPAIKIGKLSVNYGPYSIYKSFGMEGIQLRQTIPYAFKFSDGSKLSLYYEMVFSYNKMFDPWFSDENGEIKTFELGDGNSYEVVAVGRVPLYNRLLFAGKYTAKWSKLGTELSFVNVNYKFKNNTNEVGGLGSTYTNRRTETMYNFILNQKLPLKCFFTGVLALEEHMDISPPTQTADSLVHESTIDYDKDNFFRFEINNVNSLLDVTTYVRRATEDFMPRYVPHHAKYLPYRTGYDWVEEENRNYQENEIAYGVVLEKVIKGVSMTLGYENTDLYNPDDVRPWRMNKPPAHKFSSMLEYELWGTLNVIHRIKNNISKERYPDQAIGYTRANTFENECYFHFEKVAINIISRVLMQIDNNDIVTRGHFGWIKMEYTMNKFLKLIGELKSAIPAKHEPAWILNKDKYVDESHWSADNFAKLVLEFSF